MPLLVLFNCVTDFFWAGIYIELTTFDFHVKLVNLFFDQRNSTFQQFLCISLVWFCVHFSFFELCPEVVELGLKSVYLSLLSWDIGDFTAWGVTFHDDPNAIDFSKFIRIIFHLVCNLVLALLKLNKVLNLDWLYAHFLLAQFQLVQEILSSWDKNFGHNFFHFFQTFGNTSYGVVFELLKVEQKNRWLMLLA